MSFKRETAPELAREDRQSRVLERGSHEYAKWSAEGGAEQGAKHTQPGGQAHPAGVGGAEDTAGAPAEHTRGKKDESKHHGEAGHRHLPGARELRMPPFA